MHIIAELHTHSNDYCAHAHASNAEYAEIARAAGFRYLATTNHGPKIDHCPNTFYLDNRKLSFEGITFLAGMEADLRDLRGHFDVAPPDLLLLDFVIASMHVYALPHDLPDYTGMLLTAAADPAVDCLGHISRDPAYVYDLDAVLGAVKRHGKLVELNNWTVKSCDRRGAVAHVAARCAALGVEVIVTSDAHESDRIGDYDMVLELLEELHFPESLVLNADEDRMAAFLARRRAEKDAARARLFALPDGTEPA